jgi:hypothetical protein
LALARASWRTRYYSKPVTLTLAVGSFDGEATKIAAIIAGRLDAAKSAGGGLISASGGDVPADFFCGANFRPGLVSNLN